MKKVFLLFILAFTQIPIIFASEQAQDSVKQVSLEEITVLAIRANHSSPTAYSNIDAEQIKKSNSTRNIPFLLQTLPSVVSFSEDGTGTGNSFMRIRGVDATRINVTLNSMPMNNPESQEVYWVNIPALSGSIDNIQLQRGVGTSTNGSGAFGANISLKSENVKLKPYGQASTTIGSYNTFSSTIAAGTGILKNGLSVDLRYSRVTGDGYIRNGKVDHKSAFASVSHLSDNQSIKLIYIKGIQHTGITWVGISPKQLEEDRRYNSAGKYKDDAGNTLYYDNETDNYYSDILQAIYSRALSNSLKLNVALNYNHGYGYYENYKEDRKFKKFGLPNQLINDSTYLSSNMIYRKNMSNDFYVGNATLSYSNDKLSLMGGILYSYYDGDHYGKMKWIKYNKDIADNYEWYRNTAYKQESSAFIKAEYKVLDRLFINGELQYRYIDYKMHGPDDDLINITNKSQYSFLNPKIGLFYTVNENNSLYASVAIANREPLRADIKEYLKNGDKKGIKSERMTDYEVGYRFTNANAHININMYYMDYKNQMVQTGKLSDIGYKLMENVPDSYRMGIELSAGYQLFKWMRVDGNTTFSRNKIKHYTAHIYTYDNASDWNYISSEKKYLGTTDISFSPQIISSGILTIAPIRDFSVSFITKFVGKQYLDNTSDKSYELSSYHVSNLVFTYTYAAGKIGDIDLQLFINNVFNKYYVANGWGSSTDKFEDGSRSIGLYPQAPRNIAVKLGVKF